MDLQDTNWAKCACSRKVKWLVAQSSCRDTVGGHWEACRVQQGMIFIRTAPHHQYALVHDQRFGVWLSDLINWPRLY